MGNDDIVIAMPVPIDAPAHGNRGSGVERAGMGLARAGMILIKAMIGRRGAAHARSLWQIVAADPLMARVRI